MVFLCKNEMNSFESFWSRIVIFESNKRFDNKYHWTFEDRYNWESPRM